MSDRSTAEGARALRPWVAALTALYPAALAIVLVETARAAGTASGPISERFLGSFAEVCTSGLRQLGASIAVALLQALLVAGTLRARRRGPWWLSLVLTSAVQALLVRRVAIDAPHLATALPVTVAFAAVAAGHGALTIWLCLPRRLPRTRRVVGALVATASIAVAVAHYRVLVGLYPTLHSSAALLAFLFAHLGGALALSGARLGRVVRVGVVAFPAAALAAGALAPLPRQVRQRPIVAASSALARLTIAAEAPPELLRPSAPPRRRDVGPVRPDPDAERRFAEQAGLPPLPEDLRLEDYDVLFILIDALRWDRTSLADPALTTTPTLRRFVEEGAHVFTRATSPSNGTFPSMAAMLSMTVPSFAGLELHARHWHGRLSPAQRTAPEAFSAAGRRCFWVGHDFKRVMTYRVHDLWQGFDRRHNELVWPGRDLDADARIATRAIAEIRAARASKRRWFGVVFFSSPHDDYQVHDRRAPADTPLQRYDQEVRYADAQVRRVLAEVARGGGLDHTVVVVTSDHGEAFGEHGHRYHLSSVYPEQIHVPLAIRVPGSPGSIHDAPTTNLYVLPWLMLRGEPPAREAALAALRADIGPLLRETDGAVISEFISRQRQHVALRWDDVEVYYDLVADDFRIFDARADPGALHDLREERPDLVERLAPRVAAYRRARFAGQRYYFAPPEQWAPDPP